jgi:hypothetical protein
MNRNQWIAVVVVGVVILIAIGIGIFIWARKPVVVTTPPNVVVPAVVAGGKKQPQPINKARPVNAQTPTYREVTGFKGA